MAWHTAVELAYALALAEDPSLAPDLGALRTVLAPRTAAALVAADAMYRPLDEAAFTITELPPAEVHRRMDAYLIRAATLSEAPLPSVRSSRAASPIRSPSTGTPGGHGPRKSGSSTRWPTGRRTRYGCAS